ncbi:MAG: hypothetical protein JXA14_09685 [Anaerolineae bacterium]|nr:hypothetical protein [Anaerolineae bacterium]
MNTTKRTLHILLPVLILAVASLGCGFITPPTPTPEPTNTPEPTDTPVPTETPVPTPTLTPTPTPIPLPEMSTYTNERLGLSMDHPAGWYMEEDEEAATTSVVFSTEENFEPAQADGAGFGVVAVALEGAITDVEDLWNLFAGEALDEGTQIGDPESSIVGGQDAIGGSYASTEDDYYGWLTMVIANDHGYVFLAVVSPADDWKDYEPTFNALLDSVEFFEPGAGGDGGDDFASRDDVPIPADAEVALNMQQMVSYLTEATVANAVQFIEDNWPDYGWEADTGNILHQPGEGLLFYLKGSETAMIAVSEDEDSGKTSVVILIVVEE